MAVTMKEIARLAGVSQPAVSAALNAVGTTRVSAAVRARILRIARELDYIPNSAAQRLKGSKTRTIGIYGVPYVSVLTQSMMLNLSLELAAVGYNLLSCYGETEEASFRAIKELVGKGIDGLIITTAENHILKFKNPPVPYVYSPPWQMPGFDFAVDHASGTLLGAENLIEAGCRRIGFVCMRNREVFTGGAHHVSLEKLSGVRAAMKEHGLEMPDDYILTHESCQYSASSLAKRVKELRLDGLICANDYLAARLMIPLAQAGIDIPEALKIIGYDGLSICDFTPVPLATIVQPMIRLSELSVQTLLARIKSHTLRPEPCKQLLKPVFYPNESCGKIAENADQLFSTNTFSTIELNAKLNKMPKGKDCS